MTNKDLVLNVLRAQGKADALDLRARAANMTGTELIAEETKAPAFDPAKDYSLWPVGSPVSDEGQLWTLLQPYNAANYEGRPSTLRALWGLAHTTDAASAKPFVTPLGTSGVYSTGECCIDDGRVYMSAVDNNAYSPTDYIANWTYLGTVEEVQGGSGGVA